MKYFSKPFLLQNLIFGIVHFSGLWRRGIIETEIMKQAVSYIKHKLRLAAISSKFCLSCRKFRIDYQLEYFRAHAVVVRQIETQSIGGAAAVEEFFV